VSCRIFAPVTLRKNNTFISSAVLLELVQAFHWAYYWTIRQSHFPPTTGVFNLLTVFPFFSKHFIGSAAAFEIYVHLLTNISAITSSITSEHRKHAGSFRFWISVYIQHHRRLNLILNMMTIIFCFLIKHRLWSAPSCLNMLWRDTNFFLFSAGNV